MRLAPRFVVETSILHLASELWHLLLEYLASIPEPIPSSTFKPHTRKSESLVGEPRGSIYLMGTLQLGLYCLMIVKSASISSCHFVRSSFYALSGI